jgi:TIR domain
MARIFLSYASEDKSVAEPLAFSLRAHGHRVFLDKDDLPPGKNYDEQIRKAIGSCDAFIFLITPNSVVRGRYTMSELEFARQKWRSPHKRVFPIMASTVELPLIPKFLSGVTILEPQGNLTAETVAAIERDYGRPDALTASILVASLAAVGVLLWIYVFEPMPLDFLVTRGVFYGAIVGTIIAFAVWQWEGRSGLKTCVAWVSVFVFSIIHVYFEVTILGTLHASIRDVFMDPNVNRESLRVMGSLSLSLAQGIDIAFGTIGLLLGVAIVVHRFRHMDIWAIVLLASVTSGVALHALVRLHPNPSYNTLAFVMHWALTGGCIGYGFSLNR